MLETLQEKYIGDSKVHHILYVKHLGGSHAIARLFEKKDSVWTQLYEENAVIGKNGIGKQREGDGKTPSGELHLLGSFGIKPNPGSLLDYIEITGDVVACDEDCAYYNRIVHTSGIGCVCGGERMAEYVPQYNYGLITDFNSECKYPRGSNIFIHCRGEKDYTAGCIAFEENFMRILVTLANYDMTVAIE